jgi:hypothetical protein
MKYFKQHPYCLKHTASSKAGSNGIWLWQDHINVNLLCEIWGSHGPVDIGVVLRPHDVTTQKINLTSSSPWEPQISHSETLHGGNTTQIPSTRIYPQVHKASQPRWITSTLLYYLYFFLFSESRIDSVHSFAPRGFLYGLASFHTLKPVNSAPRNDPYHGIVYKGYNIYIYIYIYIYI